MKNVIVIGGGLAGLISSIQLVRAGIPCTVIEKKSYPLHKVCGEYISNEVLPFLKREKLFPDEFALPDIKIFQLSSIDGKSAKMPLDLGGFGISRFAFDYFLYRKARHEGVQFLLNTDAIAVAFSGDKFQVKTALRDYEADVVIGAFGKRSKLDVHLNRAFIKKRSPYIGVKYHIRTEHPRELISLHNFEGGYCGISNVEDGVTNLCYLAHRESLRTYGDIKTMEEAVLYRNPLLAQVFKNSNFIFKKPEVINEITFEKKQAVEDHVLMVGDAAGMITPLCGNGMAMAIHSGKIASEAVIDFCANKLSREHMENLYALRWRQHFSQRLWNGRQIQKLFGSVRASSLAINLVMNVKPLSKLIMRNTHGAPF